jgi:hypothetical protein
MNLSSQPAHGSLAHKRQPSNVVVSAPLVRGKVERAARDTPDLEAEDANAIDGCIDGSLIALPNFNIPPQMREKTTNDDNRSSAAYAETTVEQLPGAPS